MHLHTLAHHRAATTIDPARFRLVRRVPERLSRKEREAIYQFLNRHTEYDRAKLDRTLDESAYVWCCLDAKNRLVGTTAIRLIPETLEGREVTVIYTAAVAVDQTHRRHGVLAHMGLRSILLERVRRPLRPIWWFALAGSPSGYVQMAHNFVDGWPRPGAVMPTPVRDLLVRLLITVGRPDFRIRDDCFILPDIYAVCEDEQDPKRWKRADPFVEFFLRVNPDYRRGSDLACLCPVAFLPMVSAFLRRTLLLQSGPARASNP